VNHVLEHAMLDLETFGTTPGSAIRSIGAATFSMDGGVGETFYRNIRDRSCWLAGLTVDMATYKWWQNQSEEARAAFNDDPRDLLEVVTDFHTWISQNVVKHIWCQGAGFDEPIWTAAAKAVGKSVPWKFWDVRCTRTIYHLSGINQHEIKREGTHHSALDDALHQIKCVQLAAKALREKNK
jgi:inhibitor of KinA sporulation pathway (predicted exonuclease)